MMDWTGRSRKALYPQPLTTVPISLVVLDEVLEQDSLATRASHGLPGRSPPELAPQSSLRRASMGDPVRSGAAMRRPLKQEAFTGRAREIRPPCIELATTEVSRSTGGRASLSQCSPVSPLRAHVHIVLLLADHAPQYVRCARRPFARNGSFAIFFPCRQAAAFLAS